MWSTIIRNGNAPRHVYKITLLDRKEKNSASLNVEHLEHAYFASLL